MKDKSVINLIVSGGRDFDDYKRLSDSVTRIRMLDEYYTKEFVIISGHAKGADSLGEIYAKNNGLRTKIYKPDWDKYGKSAGYIRNEQMAREADAVLCFWDGQSKGTSNMINLAKKLHLPLFVERY